MRPTSHARPSELCARVWHTSPANREAPGKRHPPGPRDLHPPGPRDLHAGSVCASGWQSLHRSEATGHLAVRHRGGSAAAKELHQLGRRGAAQQRLERRRRSPAAAELAASHLVALCPPCCCPLCRRRSRAAAEQAASHVVARRPPRRRRRYGLAVAAALQPVLGPLERLRRRR
eukprot:355843-Chlamydomonas_euryale.AAC.7